MKSLLRVSLSINPASMTRVIANRNDEIMTNRVQGSYEIGPLEKGKSSTNQAPIIRVPIKIYVV